MRSLRRPAYGGTPRDDDSVLSTNETGKIRSKLMSITMLRIGTSGWSYKDWSGNFYPKKAKQSDWLSIYSEKFDTVEIDSTFYAMYGAFLASRGMAREPEIITIPPRQNISHTMFIRFAHHAEDWFLEYPLEKGHCYYLQLFYCRDSMVVPSHKDTVDCSISNTIKLIVK